MEPMPDKNHPDYRNSKYALEEVTDAVESLANAEGPVGRLGDHPGLRLRLEAILENVWVLEDELRAVMDRVPTIGPIRSYIPEIEE